MSFCPQWIEAFAGNRRRRSAPGGQGKTAGTNQEGRRGTQSLLPGPAGLRPTPGSIPGGGASAKLEAAARPRLDQGELERLCSALSAIPADLDGRTWDSYGRAIHELGWGEVGFEIWDRWSSTSPKIKPDLGAYEGRDKLARRWQRYEEMSKDYNGARITVASIYDHALSLGWFYDGGASKVNGSQTSGINGAPQPLPQQLTANPIRWLDIDGRGNPKPTCANTRVAMRHMGVECQYDLFHNRQHINGTVIERWKGEIADNVVIAIRSLIRQQWPLDPPTQTTIDALTMECLEHAYDPILDYLDSLRWDGKSRLASWTHDYLGADNSPLNGIIGGLSLVAAVRRARQPGAKFDHCVVLEGLEGMGKSSAVAILAGAENFSDQEILTLNEQRQQEALQGIWLYEIAELAGMHRADIERVKAFITRTTDRTRPAYGHYRVDQGRRCVFFASCNNDRYLLAQTGNRRFWPLKCQWIKTDALAQARDQLWAEASMIEARGGSLALPAAFWGAAAEIQDSRRVQDPWEDRLQGLEHYHKQVQQHENEYRIATLNLMDEILSIPVAQQTTPQYHRLGTVMRLLGWEGPKLIRIKLLEKEKATHVMKGFTKPIK